MSKISVEARENGRDLVSVLKATVEVRISAETPRGWLTIGGKGDSELTTTADLSEVRKAKARIIQDAAEIVRKCLWEADVALERALTGGVNEVQDRRVQRGILHDKERRAEGQDSPEGE